MGVENGTTSIPDLKIRIYLDVLGKPNRFKNDFFVLENYDEVYNLFSKMGDMASQLGEFCELTNTRSVNSDNLPYKITGNEDDELFLEMDFEKGSSYWHKVPTSVDLESIIGLKLAQGEHLNINKFYYSSVNGWDAGEELSFRSNLRLQRHKPCFDPQSIVNLLTISKLWQEEQNYFWPLIGVLLASRRNEELRFTADDVEIIKENLPKISPSPITLAKSLYLELEDAKEKLGIRFYNAKVLISKNESGLTFKFVYKRDTSHEYAIFSIGSSGDYYNSIYPGLTVKEVKKTDEKRQIPVLIEAVVY